MSIYESVRLIIKEISLEDAEAIHRLHSFPEVDEYNTLGIPENIDETKAYLLPFVQARESTPRKSFLWKIILRDTYEFIGIAGLTLSADKFNKGEIYYKILPNYWRRGYATEVAMLLLNLGFKNFNLHRIEAGVATDNVSSIRVLEKIGMTREGQHRKILPIRGEWIDNYHYAILENDAGE